MYARATTIDNVTNMDGGIEYVHDVVLPLFDQQKGYRELMISVDPSASDLRIFSIWDSEADRETSEDAMGPARYEGVKIMGGTVRIELFEELFFEVANLPAVGTSLWLSRYLMDPRKIDGHLKFFCDEIAPTIAELPGFYALRNIVNRQTGEGVFGNVWRDKASLRNAEARLEGASKSEAKQGVALDPPSQRQIVLVDSRRELS